MKKEDAKFWAVLGMLITIGGLVWHLSSTLTRLQTMQVVMEQQIRDQQATILAYQSKIGDNQTNITRVIQMVADQHNGGRGN
jgi:hypothetical protein